MIASCTKCKTSTAVYMESTAEPSVGGTKMITATKVAVVTLSEPTATATGANTECNTNTTAFTTFAKEDVTCWRFNEYRH